MPPPHACVPGDQAVRVRVEDLELRVPNLGFGFRITRKRGREAQGKRQEARGKRQEARLMRAREESTSREQGGEQGRRAREERGTCPPREIQSIMAENTHPCPGPNVAKSIPPLPPGTKLNVCHPTRNTQHATLKLVRPCGCSTRIPTN
jgi:hypothetical protein